MATRLRGLNPLSYVGVDPVNPTQAVIYKRNPTINDYSNFTLQCQWLNSETQQLWVLVSQEGGQGTWKEITGGGGGGIQTITGDLGGAVPGDGSNNIDLHGGGHYVFTGNPGANLITLSDDGTISYSYTADVGTAAPSANNLNIIGSGAISTSGAGDTITISAAGTVAVQIDGDSGSATPIAGILNVFGGDNITTSAAGNTVTAAVSGTTDNAVQVGNALGSLTSLPLGTDGQIVIGATGATPLFADLTSTDLSVTITPGPNTLDLSVAGAGPGVTTIQTDAGNASPAAGTLNVYGDASHIQTTGVGNTVTAELYGFTDHAPVVGNASGSLDSLLPMTTGQLMIGVTGSVPNLAKLTAGSNITIDDVSIPGEITISSTGGGGGGIITTTFTSSDVWVPHADTEYVYVQIWSGGGGGASGTSGNGTPSSTGVGGCGGSCIGASFYLLPRSSFGANATVTIGAGGSGGVGVTSAGTGLYGNDGATGSISSVDDLVGGLPGQSVIASLSAASPTFTALDVGGTGGSPSGSFPVTPPGAVFNNTAPFLFLSTGGLTNGLSSVDRGGGQPSGFNEYNVRPYLLSYGGSYYFTPTLAGSPTSGGGGGSLLSAVSYAGGRGGGIWSQSGSYAVTGAAGSAASSGLPGTDGSDASTVAANGIFSGGLGGGGGCNSGVNTNGTRGGHGGFPGGGGAGGGGCSLGHTSGDGGDGADGMVVIYEFLSSGGGAAQQIVGMASHDINSTILPSYVSLFGDSSTNQVDRQYTMPISGTFSDLYFNIGTNSATNTNTLILNKNGVNTAMGVSYLAGATGVFSDLVNTVSVSIGDTVQFEASLAITGAIKGTISIKFTPS
jgi:hypothetical protein